LPYCFSSSSIASTSGDLARFVRVLIVGCYGCCERVKGTGSLVGIIVAQVMIWKSRSVS
jgi:hypothetical protein